MVVDRGHSEFTGGNTKCTPVIMAYRCDIAYIEHYIKQAVER